MPELGVGRSEIVSTVTESDHELTDDDGAYRVPSS